MRISLLLFAFLVSAVFLAMSPQECQARKYSCEVVNSTGQTIYVKIVGHEPDATWYPGRTGVLHVNGSVTDDLFEGKRYLVAWDHTGKALVALGDFNIDGPLTITIGADGSATGSYPGFTIRRR